MTFISEHGWILQLNLDEPTLLTDRTAIPFPKIHKSDCNSNRPAHPRLFSSQNGVRFQFYTSGAKSLENSIHITSRVFGCELR
jgi:hypothetical protein